MAPSPPTIMLLLFLCLCSSLALPSFPPAPARRELSLPGARAALSTARAARSAGAPLPPGDEWVRDDARVRRDVALPLTGHAPIELVTVTLSDGRTFPAHAPSAAALPAGDGVPLQGVLRGGVLYLDEAAHECHGEDASCTIGGAPLRRFATPKHAAVEAQRAREGAARRHLEELGLAAPTAPAARALQLGATAGGAGMQHLPSNATLGVRSVLALRVKWRVPDPICVQSDPPYGNGQPYPTNVSEALVQRAVARLKDLTERRSFGGVRLDINLPPCVYQLDTTSYAGVAGMAAFARDAAATAPGACNIPTTAFDSYLHVMVFMPDCTSRGMFKGIANTPGKILLIDGDDGLDAFGRTITHEFGHNYGLRHSSTYREDLNLWSEYGDPSNVMGSAFSMEFGDYNAAQKHQAGWIPDERVLDVFGGNGAPGVRAGLASSGVFLLAASDRDSPPADRAGALAPLPATVALAARAAVPRRSYLYPWFQGDNSETYTTPNYAYVSYRAQGRGGPFWLDKNDNQPAPFFNASGVYIHEISFLGSIGANPVLHCYRDPKCKWPRPIEPFDATVFDAAKARLLVEVGPSQRVFPGGATTAAADSALLVRVLPLDDAGLPIDGSAPLGCTARGCAALPTVTPITASGVVPVSLSEVAPVAVFSFQPATDTVISATTCLTGARAGRFPYSVPLALSGFIGPFPTAHAYYGGNVGVTGDVNSPGTLQPVLWNATCFTINFAVRAGSTAWVVAGSPGAARGSALADGAVTFSLSAGSTVAASMEQYAMWPPEETSCTDYLAKVSDSPAGYVEQSFAWGGDRIAYARVAEPCDFCYNQPVFRAWGYPWMEKTYIRYYATPFNDGEPGRYDGQWRNGSWGQWAISSFPSPGAPTQPRCIKQNPNKASGGHMLADDVLAGVCPSGSYSIGRMACAACPLPNQLSSLGASSPADCHCPAGWSVWSGKEVTACAGQHSGGPLATRRAAGYGGAPCPINSRHNKESGACEDCPLGTSGVDCLTSKDYPLIEVIDTANAYVRPEFSCLLGVLPRVAKDSVDVAPFGVPAYGPSATTCPGYGAVYYKYTVREEPCCSAVQWFPYAEYGSSGYGFLSEPVLKKENYGYAPTAVVELLSQATLNGLGSFQVRPAWRITPESIAFCALGDATTDFMGRRVCYCGPGLYKTGAGVCAPCAAATFRAIGGTASKVETCAACPSGTASAAGAAACAASCPAGTVQSGQACMAAQPAAALSCPAGTAPDAASGTACIARTAGFRCNGAACALCPLFAASDANGAACICPGGYVALSSGACAPPASFSLLAASGLADNFTLARLQYVPVAAPLVGSISGASAGALVWRASPVYVGAVTGASFYWAFGGPWGRSNATGLLSGGSGAPTPVAGSSWALDPVGALYLTSPASPPASLTVPLATTPVPGPLPATFGAAPASNSEAAPLTLNSLFLYSPASLRAFLPMDVALSAGAAPGAPLLASQLGAPATLTSGAALAVVIKGLVGTGDRLALVPATTPCASITDPSPASAVLTTGLAIATLSSGLAASFAATPPPAAGQARWALCLARQLAVWQSAAPSSAAPFVTVFDATGAVPATLAVAGASLPFACASGFYNPTDGTASSACLACPTGTSSSAGASSCAYTCTAGTFNPSGGATSASCLTCAANSWAAAGAASCTICGAGLVAPAGSFSAAACAFRCSAGYANPSGGATGAACQLCAANSWAAPGSTACNSCAPGLVSPAGSSTAAACAYACAANYYNPSGGAAADACLRCPVNTAAPAGASSCAFVCAAGSANPGGGSTFLSCEQCPANTWAAAGAASCTLCGPGLAAPPNSTSAAACYYGCAPGDGNPTRGLTSSACVLCPSGTWSAAGAASCSACPNGLRSPVRSTSPEFCQAACWPGTYNRNAYLRAPEWAPYLGMDATRGVCLSCASNTYSAGNVTACTACPAGRFTNSTLLQITDDWTKVGDYTHGAVSVNECLAPPPYRCFAGSYNPTASASADACKNCAANTWSAEGSASCTLCPTGYVSPPSSTSADACTLAPPYSCYSGYYNPTGGIKDTDCKTCPTNTYSFWNATSCWWMCLPGFTNPTKGSTAASCISCPANTYASGYNPPADWNRYTLYPCSPCPSGYFAPPGSKQFSDCVQTTFSATASATSSASATRSVFTQTATRSGASTQSGTATGSSSATSTASAKTPVSIAAACELSALPAAAFDAATGKLTAAAAGKLQAALSSAVASVVAGTSATLTKVSDPPPAPAQRRAAHF